MSYLSFHCHSEYSKQDAISKVEDIAKRNKELGNDAFCITDHGWLGSFIKAYQVADKLGMQFIPGCEFYVLPDKEEFWLKSPKEVEKVDGARRYHHLIAVAKNQTGLHSLFALYNSHEEHYGKPCVTKQSLFENKQGLIVTNACVSGELLNYLRFGYDEYAEQALLEYKENFGEDFYVELQYHNLTFMDEVKAYSKLIALAKKHNIEMVAATDSHYTLKQDKVAHDIYKDIYKPDFKFDLSQDKFPDGFDGEGYYIQSEEEITKAISHLPLTQEEIKHVIANSLIVRNKCEVTHFPKAKPLSNKKITLWEMVRKGFEEKRLGTPLEKASRERIKEELQTISEMGFTEYFINMYNIIKRAKDLGLLVGCGRGSAAGSEVVYLLGITNIDPLTNGLLFERFLNKGRAQNGVFPDVDTDIQSSLPPIVTHPIKITFDDNSIKQYQKGYKDINGVCIDEVKEGDSFEEKVIQNIEDVSPKVPYTLKAGMNGKDLLIESLSEDLFPFAGQIVNETRASTLMLFKQLARAFSLNSSDVNKITTDVEVAEGLFANEFYCDPNDPNDHGWLEKQLELKNIPIDEKWQRFNKYIGFCYKYGGNGKGDYAQGLLINSSIHASGVILYPDKDPNILPKNSQGVTYRGHALEAMGYIKYDLLGLASLDPISYFIPKIEKDTGKKFSWEDTYDKETWKVFHEADTDFVFQFASNGMKRGLRAKKPTTINQLAELNALYRPGCLKAGIFEAYITDDFNDEQKTVGHFLQSEFGEDHSLAMIFQEDIMKIVEKMAGFTLSEADLIRRAVQRKDKELMESYKEQFINNFDTEKYGDIAENVWEAIDGCASYVFNKSHAVAYACIAYWLAYIFCHYKNEFFAWALEHDYDRQRVLEYLAQERIIKFPTIKTQNTNWEVTDSTVCIPTLFVSNQTVPEYLFSLNTAKKQMIVKYGVLDGFCVDRKGLRDMIALIPAKTIKSITDIQMQQIDGSDISRFLHSLAVLGILEYEEFVGGYNIKVYTAKSYKECVIHRWLTKEILFTNAQEDIRAFGVVRSRYAGIAPYINLSKYRRQENMNNYTFKMKIKQNNPLIPRIEDTPYDCIMKEAKIFNGKGKITLVFSDKVLEAKFENAKVYERVKTYKKNTPVTVKFDVDPIVYEEPIKANYIVREIDEREFHNS